jgi:hypothetical protein
MSGAPITVVCYRNGIDGYHSWITDRAALDRVRALVAEGGVKLVEDVIWNEREPWTKKITSGWPAVDSFNVVLALDEDYAPPVTSAAARPAKKKGK